MELYITGDTHGDFSRFRPESFYEQERLWESQSSLTAFQLRLKIILEKL